MSCLCFKIKLKPLKQITFLMIPNGGGRRWNYVSVKKLSALLRSTTSKNNCKFYCLNCHHSFRTKNKLELHKKVCENECFCNVIMPSEETKILEFNQNQKSNKALFVVYADHECIIEKTDGCKNNPENSSRTKLNKHILSGCSVSKI